MKINKILKKVLVFALIVLAIIINLNYVYAWDPKWDMFDNTEGRAPNATKAVTDVVGAAINIMSVVGAGVAIIMLIVVGLKYITQSPAGKAEAKKDLPNYIIGAVILFASSGILKLLQMFIDANVNNI